jgi:hypothetical protein
MSRHHLLLHNLRSDRAPGSHGYHNRSDFPTARAVTVGAGRGGPVGAVLGRVIGAVIGEPFSR